jgi:host factor-I protein
MERKRGAPPEDTGAEANYLRKNREARTPMIVKLIGGQEVRGWIEYYDRDVVKINRNDPPHLLIRKDTIVTIRKDEDEEARLSQPAPPPRERRASRKPRA